MNKPTINVNASEYYNLVNRNNELERKLKEVEKRAESLENLMHSLVDELWHLKKKLMSK